MLLAACLVTAWVGFEACHTVHLEGKFMAVCHTADTRPRVMFPLPLAYRGQVPLSFKLVVSPRSELASAKTYGADNGNQIVEIGLKPMRSGDRVDIHWKSDVLVREVEAFELPKAVPFPQVYPEEAAEWANASRFVNSTHPDIRAKAGELRGSDVIETINKTVTGCVSIISKQKGHVADMSASLALRSGGSCTSNANLMAALLRANGIPARILAGYPVWVNAPYQTHYIVEAYVVGFGWYPIESTAFAKGWPCANMPIASIVSLENEGKGVQRLNGGAGVAYLSVNESSDGLVLRGLLSREYADHLARADHKHLELSDERWETTRLAWNTWLEATRVKLTDLP